MQDIQERRNQEGRGPAGPPDRDLITGGHIQNESNFSKLDILDPFLSHRLSYMLAVEVDGQHSHKIVWISC
jgi:hypothetical protein